MVHWRINLPLLCATQTPNWESCRLVEPVLGIRRCRDHRHRTRSWHSNVPRQHWVLKWQSVRIPSWRMAHHWRTPHHITSHFWFRHLQGACGQPYIEVKQKHAKAAQNVRTSHGSWGCCQVDFNSLFSSYLPHSPQTNPSSQDFNSHSQENKLWTGPSLWSSGQKPQNVWHGTLDFAPVPPRWQMDVWVDNHKLLCFQGRHGMRVLRYNVKCQNPKHQSIPDLCKLLDVMIYCWSLLRIGRVVLSDTVSIRVIPPTNRSLLSSFTGSSAIHFQHHLSRPPTQSFWTFSRPSFLSAKWPSLGK